MAIFELLNYIVNEPPPELPPGLFSADFESFVSSCLQKDPTARADLNSLMNHQWIKRCVQENPDIAGWIQKTMETQTPSENN